MMSKWRQNVVVIEAFLGLEACSGRPPGEHNVHVAVCRCKGLKKV
jgi:hypothetical protein